MVVLNDRMGVVKVPSLSDEYCVVVGITEERLGSVQVVSMYCRLSEECSSILILFGCERWSRKRKNLAGEIRELGYQESDDKELFMNEHCYGLFKRFVDKVVSEKGLEDRILSLIHI